MGWFKRVFLFLALNFLVITTITIVLNVLNVGPYLRERGLDLPSLLIFCLVWGMGGALISLALSRTMAKWMMGIQVIDPERAAPTEKQLYALVERLAEKANLPSTPEVGIYHSPEVNAFATGPTQRRSLVAVSTGLLNKMGDKEIEGVLGHELSHIANGDMVTMTLLQGVVNAFVMFLARVLAYALSSFGKDRRESGSYMSYMLFVYLFQTVFMVLGSLLIAAYSRWREFRADAGGAKIAGKEAMISALERLQALQERQDPAKDQPALAAFKISHPAKKGMFHLFATHPPLEERIAALRQ